MVKIQWAQLLKAAILIQLGFFFGLILDPPIRKWYFQNDVIKLLEMGTSAKPDLPLTTLPFSTAKNIQQTVKPKVNSESAYSDEFQAENDDNGAEEDPEYDGGFLASGKSFSKKGKHHFVAGSLIRDPSGRHVDLFSLAKTGRPDVDYLSPDSVYNVVHYIWCNRKIFEFQHYLSFKSAMKYIQPDRIIFHYAHYPRSDKFMYNTWFEDIKLEYPYIDLEDLGGEARACQSSTTKYEVIRELLMQNGGIFMHENTIMTSFPPKFRTAKVINGLTKDTEGFLVAKANSMPDVVENLIADLEVSCVEYSNFNRTRGDHVCITKKDTYFPRDTWNKSDDFNLLVKSLFYGQENLPVPTPSAGDLIPNIAHMMWLGGQDMNFLFFLSCLSLLHVVKVEKLYIHGNEAPSNDYWNRIIQDKRVIFVKRPWPNLIYRKETKIWNHMSDILRGDVLIRYGGIYSDTDAIWVKPIPEELRRYDAIASYDWPQMYPTYPDYINFGISLGKPNAPFWKEFLQSMQEFRDDIYGYNGLLRPYKVFEKHPELLYLYPYLQVMCWNLRCHPTWDPKFRNANQDHRNLTNFNWREAHAIHWTAPDPKEFKDEQTLRNATGLWAEMGQVVLKAAGLL